MLETDYMQEVDVYCSKMRKDSVVESIDQLDQKIKRWPILVKMTYKVYAKSLQVQWAEVKRSPNKEHIVSEYSEEYHAGRAVWEADQHILSVESLAAREPMRKMKTKESVRCGRKSC
jgi:hypothetical protein